MAKRRVWPWILGVFVVGWLLGDNDEPSPSLNLPSNTIVSPDRTVTPTRRDQTSVEITHSRQPQQPAEMPRRSDGEQARAERMYVTASRLNIRERPGTQYEIVGSLERNAAIVVTERSGPWRYVTGIPNAGWVHGDYLTSERSAVRQPTQPQQRIVSGPSDSEIVQILIRQSIARYSGSCPCPYNTDRAGRSCGRHSEHSRPGGASPLCFPDDVTAQMIARFRARQ